MKKRANIAVIMAAGRGVRHGTNLPKQYMEL
jgi:2-C-methyl-D-erythritol 4-phosphate cytidylyltransferase